METRKSKTQSEEEYFYHLNRELIERQRGYLDEVRKSKESLARQKLHWMKCPKCGDQMSEREFTGVMVDHCQSCGGIYLDKGELELVLSAQQPESFIQKLKSFFARERDLKAM